MSVLEKYLKTYATKFTFSDQEFSCDSAVVLPIFGESTQDVTATLTCLKLAARNASKHVLAILVVNQRVNAKSEYKQKNQELLDCYGIHSELYKLIKDRDLSLALLNYTALEKEFSEKEGVGLARKIGCDYAAKLYFNKQLSSEWIYTTDIDARVPLDYFSLEQTDKDTALKLFPFRHSFDEEDGEALLYYDLWLRYYTLSLKKAGSPFAFSTLGSTFCINVEAYAKVRGFPNRLAAEDFHLASKLSKVGTIAHSKLSPINLMARKSDRVPFGTGVGTDKYLQSIQKKFEITFINPDCFNLLHSFLVSADTHIKNPTTSTFSIPKEIDLELDLTGIIKTAIGSRTNTKDRLLHFRTTFDALKTLRFIHLAETFYYAKINYKAALRILNLDYNTETKTLFEISELMAKDELSI